MRARRPAGTRDRPPCWRGRRARESNARVYGRHFPIAVEEASGSFVRDVDGNVFIDFLTGAGVLSLGHGHPELVEVATEQLGRFCHGLDLPSPAKDAFTTAQLSMLPEGMRDRMRVHFCGPTGANAVDAALKLCKTATGRGDVVAFSGPCGRAGRPGAGPRVAGWADRRARRPRRLRGAAASASQRHRRRRRHRLRHPRRGRRALHGVLRGALPSTPDCPVRARLARRPGPERRYRTTVVSTALPPGGSSGAAAVPVPGRPDPRILVDGAHGRHQRWWRPGERLEHLFEQRCEQLRAEDRPTGSASTRRGLRSPTPPSTPARTSSRDTCCHVFPYSHSADCPLDLRRGARDRAGRGRHLRAGTRHHRARRLLQPPHRRRDGRGDDALRAHLRERLPPYMVPAYLEHLPVVPMTTADKADRKALPPPTTRRTADGGVRRAHRADRDRARRAARRDARPGAGLDRRPPLRRPRRELAAPRAVRRTGARADHAAADRDAGHVPAPHRDRARGARRRRACRPTPPRCPRAAPRPREGASEAAPAAHLLCGAVQLVLFLVSVTVASGVIVVALEWLRRAATFVDLWQRSMVVSTATFGGYSRAVDGGEVAAGRALEGRGVPAVGSALPAVLGRAADPAGQPARRVRGVAALQPVPAVPRRPRRRRRRRHDPRRPGVHGPAHDRARRGRPEGRASQRLPRRRGAHPDRPDHDRRRRGGRRAVGARHRCRAGRPCPAGHASSLQSGQVVPDGESWHGSPAVRCDVDYRLVRPRGAAAAPVRLRAVAAGERPGPVRPARPRAGPALPRAHPGAPAADRARYDDGRRPRRRTCRCSATSRRCSSAGSSPGSCSSPPSRAWCTGACARTPSTPSTGSATGCTGSSRGRRTPASTACCSATARRSCTTCGSSGTGSAGRWCRAARTSGSRCGTRTPTSAGSAAGRWCRTACRS